MSDIKLGDKVRDRITGMEGVALGRTQWLYGCVRIAVQATVLKDGVSQAMEWIDEPQLESLGASPAAERSEEGDPAGPRADPCRAPEGDRGNPPQPVTRGG